MQNARTGRARHSRERIVDAAIELFSQRGYQGTTVAAIGREIGMSDAGVLHHYPTKKAIFRAVVERFAEIQADRFLSVLAPGGLAALRNLADWGYVLEERPELLRLQVLLSAEGTIATSDLHAYWRDRYRDLPALLGEVIHEAVARGELRSDVDAVAEARGLVAQLEGARLQWCYATDDVSMAAIFHRYVEHLIERLS